MPLSPYLRPSPFLPAMPTQTCRHRAPSLVTCRPDKYNMEDRLNRLSRVTLFLVCLLGCLPLLAQNLEIHYIDVGWGGAVLVKGPNGTTVLMDSGNTGKGTSYVVPYLQSIGIQPAN